MTNQVAGNALPADYRALTPDGRRSVREQYIREQSGKCYHCKAPLDGPPAPAVAGMKVTPRLYPASFFRFPVHLHHHHGTGLTIGAVHNHCNAVLWEHHGE